MALEAGGRSLVVFEVFLVSVLRNVPIRQGGEGGWDEQQAQHEWDAYGHVT